MIFREFTIFRRYNISHMAKVRTTKTSTFSQVGKQVKADLKKATKTAKKVGRKTTKVAKKAARTGKKVVGGVDKFMYNLWK